MAEEINITYENNVFHCTKNGTKWISIDGEKWYGEEKRIEELEETINKLREQFALRYDLEDKLKKENAELDMKRKAERQIFQGIVEKKNEQLTKAKEIIRTFLNMPMPNNEEVFADVGMFLTKAEQFLKEIEK